MIGFGSGTDVGLTFDGAQEAVRRHCAFDDMHREPRTKATISIQDMFRALIVAPDGRTTDELMVHFRPVDHAPAADLGRYNDLMSSDWWDDVGRPRLSDLPGVEQDGDRWRFVGLPDPGEFDKEHARPLDDLREDPHNRVAATLDDEGIQRRSDVRTAVTGLWERLLGSEQITEETLRSDRTLRSVDWGEVKPLLLTLPGVSRETERPPDPEAIDVETMADVLEGYAAIEQEPTDVWRCDVREEAAPKP